MNEPTIAVEHLSLRYDGVTALDDITFSVEPGMVLGLVGRNGAGKSSLLQCMLGLTVAQEGSAKLLGCESVELTDTVRARLGYVAQTPELFGWLRVGEHADLLGALYPGWTQEIARDLLRRFDLAPDVRVSKLSPGERQRLAIVLALQHRPDLLIFDEPVASLDPVGRRDFLRSLFDHDALNHEALTVVISSHLLEDLERVVTHVMFLDKGRIQLCGSRDELAEHVRTAFTEKEIRKAPGLLRCHQLSGKLWQSVIDMRVFALSSLPADARVQALGLSDLFVALNS